MNIGFVYRTTDHLSESLTNYQQSLTLFRAVGDKFGEAWALNGLGVVYQITGRPAEALISYQQALQMARAINDKIVETHALFRLGDVYTDTGRPAEALKNYQQALQIAYATGDKNDEIWGLNVEANAEQQLGQREAAKADYVAGIDLIEQIRADLGGYTTAKQAYSASVRSIYSDYLGLLLTAPKSTNVVSSVNGSSLSETALSGRDTGTAFTLSQRMKGRVLLDLLDSGEVNLTGSLTDDEKAQLRILRQESDALNVQLVQEGVENEVGAKARFAALQQQQQENESKLQRLTETLYALHPDLAEKHAANTATIADLTSLLDADTALLEYVRTPDHLAVFVVMKNEQSATGKSHVTAQYLSVPNSLAADCAVFQSACADPRKDYKPLASSLYQTLIAPIASMIVGKKRLIVCPDGPLWNVPFQALLTEDSKTFLADRFEVDYAYSATGALAARSERQRQIANSSVEGAAGKEGSLLVVANPAFGDAKRFGDLDDLPGQRPIDKPSRPIDSPSRPLDSPSRPLDTPSRPIELPSRAMAASLERAGGKIAELPGTQREADALKTLFPQATVLTGKAAQETTVKKDAPNFRYLHFATHGFINDGAPMLSSLVLAQPDAAAKAAGENGFLTARDLFELHLPNTEMVTLSACNTGRGDIQSGEGVVGLTWALFAAGCPTQVVSQWSVDDACTATLMARFYTELKAGKPKGQALHDAAQATASEGGTDGPHRHPYYWAPFVLFGEWK